MGVRGVRKKGSSPIKMNVDAMLNYAFTKDMISSYKLDIKSLINIYGIKLVMEDLPTEISGILKKEGSSWSIFVNKKHSCNRQRYTMAHEFAHYCLHRDSSQNFEDKSFFRREENKATIEYEANQFAAELLMPEESIKEAISSDILVLKDLAESFGVSLIAMKNRLINLGYKLIEHE